MRTLILLVAASLVIIIRASPPLSELKYGDILAFPRKRFCGIIPYTYKHYAIYLDKKRFPEQTDDHNIFHLTGPLLPEKFSDCVFGNLRTEGDFELDNYLDNFEMFKNKETMSEQDITTRITEKYKKCKWWPRANNCEHIATYVRYGYKLSFQCGQQAAKVVKNPGIDKEMLEKIKKYLGKEKYEDIHKELELAVKTSAGQCSAASSRGPSDAG